MSIKSVFQDTLSRFHRGCGIYVDNTTVYICHIASEFRGIHIEQAAQYELGDKKLAGLLRELYPNAITQEDLENEQLVPVKRNIIQKLLRWMMALPELLSVGIKDTSVFYYAFATSFKVGKTLDMDTIVSDNPRAEFLHSSNLTNDWTSTQINEQNYILMAVTKKNAIDEVYSVFYKMGLSPVRLEAGPLSALRAAWHYYPPEQNKIPEIVVLIGPNMTLIALTLGTMTLAWQLIQVDQTHVPESIFPVVQSFITYAQKQFNFQGIHQVVIHGEIATDEDASKLAEMTAMPCKAVQGKPYDGNFIAFGLALGSFDMDMKQLNLARTEQKPVPFMMIFPYLESMITIAIVMTSMLYMVTQTTKLEKSVHMQQAINSQNPKVAGMSAGDVAAKNNELKKQIAPLSELFTGKVPWYSVLEALSRIETSNIRIVTITGSDPVWTAKKQPAMTMVIMAKSDGVSKPETEIESFLAKLRASREFSAWFPKIVMTSVQLTGDELRAIIICGSK
jgi:hypothetical protein